MTEPTRTPRKRNPDWKDTPEQKRVRQKRRYEMQRTFAQAHGFTSWAALVAAA